MSFITAVDFLMAFEPFERAKGHLNHVKLLKGTESELSTKFNVFLHDLPHLFVSMGV